MEQYKESDLTLWDIEYIQENHTKELYDLWEKLDIRMWRIWYHSKKRFMIFGMPQTFRELAIRTWIKEATISRIYNKYWNITKALNITKYE